MIRGINLGAERMEHLSAGHDGGPDPTPVCTTHDSPSCTLQDKCTVHDKCSLSDSCNFDSCNNDTCTIDSCHQDTCDIDHCTLVDS
jgi:hypothetical protein